MVIFPQRATGATKCHSAIAFIEDDCGHRHIRAVGWIQAVFPAKLVRIRAKLWRAKEEWASATIVSPPDNRRMFCCRSCAVLLLPRTVETSKKRHVSKSAAQWKLLCR